MNITLLLQIVLYKGHEHIHSMPFTVLLLYLKYKVI